MTDLHEMRLRAGKNLQDVFARLAEVEADLKSVLDREAATTARYDARLAEVERERDEARTELASGSFYEEADIDRLMDERDEARARVAAAYEEAAAAANLVPNQAHPADYLDAIHALARPEETDALAERDARIKEAAMRVGYLLGFKASGEGWNQEYPFDDNGASPTTDAYWLEKRDAAIAAAIREDKT